MRDRKKERKRTRTRKKERERERVKDRGNQIGREREGEKERWKESESDRKRELAVGFIVGDRLLASTEIAFVRSRFSTVKSSFVAQSLTPPRPSLRHFFP